MNKICFTGKLTKFTRDEARALAQDAGYQIETSVTKLLDILVVADPNSNSIKLQNAKKFGVRIISEQEFLDEVGKDLEEKHLKIKAKKEDLEVTWEKLLKKICRKIGVECSIRNMHDSHRTWSIDYSKDDWVIDIMKRNPTLHLASNIMKRNPASNYMRYEDHEIQADKEKACKDAIVDLFNTKRTLTPKNYFFNKISDALKELPMLSEFDLKNISVGSPNYLKLKLEIAGWNNMLES